MFRDLDSWQINADLVRLVLFRVLPGHEVQVGRMIERRCRDADIRRARYRILDV
jgi:hypothetical protein